MITFLEENLRRWVHHARGERLQFVSIPCDFADEIVKVLQTRRDMCRWPWNHVWEKWETIETGQHVAKCDEWGHTLPDGVTRIVGYYIRQARVCKTCGKSQLRKVSA